MSWFDVGALSKIGNSAGDLDDAEIRTGAEVEPFGGCAKQLPHFGRQAKMLLYLLRAEIAVVFETTSISVMLHVSCTFNLFFCG